MADTEFGSSEQELDELFDMDEEKKLKIAGIKDRLKMPDPSISGDRVTCRVLYYQNPDGTTQWYKKVSGEKFTNTAVFLNVEDVEQPGIEKDLSVGKTLYQSLTREVTNRGMKMSELPGKVLIITAGYWTSAPKSKRSNVCPNCNGQGCAFCTVSGNGEDAGKSTGYAPPTRFDCVIKNDMNVGGKKKDGGALEF